MDMYVSVNILPLEYKVARRPMNRLCGLFADAAIFFEFKHWKPKKKKMSTRCWAFMELQEMRPDEEIALEM